MRLEKEGKEHKGNRRRRVPDIEDMMNMRRRLCIAKENVRGEEENAEVMI